MLRRLPPEDLARFALASRSAWQAAAADELWRGPWLALAPAAEGRAPPLPPPPDGHRAAFARLRRRACADCGAQTRHVFALLNRRLCQRCEAHDPGRYGLATELEARERWGLGEAALDALPCVEAFRRRWFLRSAVAALAEARERPAATGEESDSSGGSGRDGDSSGGGGSQGGEEQEPTAGWQPAAGAPEGSSSGGGGGDNGGEGDAAAVLARLRALELQQAQREARRAARKEHKKQVRQRGEVVCGVVGWSGSHEGAALWEQANRRTARPRPQLTPFTCHPTRRSRQISERRAGTRLRASTGPAGLCQPPTGSSSQRLAAARAPRPAATGVAGVGPGGTAEKSATNSRSRLAGLNCGRGTPSRTRR